MLIKGTKKAYMLTFSYLREEFGLNDEDAYKLKKHQQEFDVEDAKALIDLGLATPIKVAKPKIEKKKSIIVKFDEEEN